MPDGTPLEQTRAVAQALGSELARQPEVVNYQTLRRHVGPVQLQRPGAALLPAAQAEPGRHPGEPRCRRSERNEQSHEIARRLRPLLVAIGKQFGARIKVSEVPPGPPVLQTLVAEVYGPDLDGQTRVAQQIKSIFQQTAGRGRCGLVRRRPAAPAR